MSNIIYACDVAPVVVYVKTGGNANNLRLSTSVNDDEYAISSCLSGWVPIDIASLGGSGGDDLSIGEVESLMAGVLLMFTAAFVFKFVRRQFSKSDN